MKAILVGVEYDHMYYDLDISMNELRDLSEACHIEVKDVVIQKLSLIYIINIILVKVRLKN